MRRDPRVLLVVLSAAILLSCSADEPVCETWHEGLRQQGLEEQRWILWCATDSNTSSVVYFASYFDPEWTEDLPSGAEIYCSDERLHFAWAPGVRSSEPAGRWREKTVVHRIDGGPRVQSRWMVSTDNPGAQPTYCLFDEKAAEFVEDLREARELLLETQVEHDEEPTIRLVTLEGLRDVLDRIPCVPEG